MQIKFWFAAQETFPITINDENVVLLIDIFFVETDTIIFFRKKKNCSMIFKFENRNSSCNLMHPCGVKLLIYNKKNWPQGLV